MLLGVQGDAREISHGVGRWYRRALLWLDIEVREIRLNGVVWLGFSGGGVS